MTSREEAIYVDALQELINSAMVKFIRISRDRDEGDEDFYNDYFCNLALQGKEHELSPLIVGFVSGTINSSNVACTVINYFNELEIEEVCKIIIESSNIESSKME